MILRTHQAWKTSILELNKAPLPCRMEGTALGLCLTGTFGEVADGNLSTLRHSCIGSDSGAVWGRQPCSLGHTSTACCRGDGDVTWHLFVGTKQRPCFSALVICLKHCIRCGVISGYVFWGNNIYVSEISKHSNYLPQCFSLRLLGGASELIIWGDRVTYSSALVH